MTINTMTIKYLGKKVTVYRLLNSNNEVCGVFYTKEEAEAAKAAL